MSRRRGNLLFAITLICSLALSAASGAYFASQQEQSEQQAVEEAVKEAVPAAVKASLYVAFRADVISERKGCRRLDAVRGTTYRILYAAALTNRDDAYGLPRGSPLRQRQLEAAAAFERELRRLLRSVDEFMRNAPPNVSRLSFDKLPTEIRVDCRRAYPFPVQPPNDAKE